MTGWLIERHPEWKTIRSIGVVESSREVRGETTVERHLFVSNPPAEAEPFVRADRGTKISMIGRRKQMAWSNEYLEPLLFQSSFASASE
jgi:hypothetical protein